MKIDTLPPTKPMPTKSARATTPNTVPLDGHGPIPGKGPWFRLDGVWYTQDESGEWVIMPGQPKAKKLKQLPKISINS